MRNCAGVFASGFSGFITNSTYILLEKLTVIYQRLILIRDLGIDEFVCYSDSLICISLITGTVGNFHVYATLIPDITNLIHTSTVSLHHTIHEGNQCADFLAKFRATSDYALTVHVSPPDGICILLMSDAIGTFFSRE